MLPFRLSVLGPPELHAPDGDPIRFRTRKHFALLLFLAVEPPVPHRRTRLASLLWSGADSQEAHHSLATALSLLRGRLGPGAFDTSRGGVRLVPGTIATDLHALECDVPSNIDAAPLGAFLEDFDIDDALEFAVWKEGQRARLMSLLQLALVSRIEFCRRHGDSRRMEMLAQRLVRVDDLNEEAMRARLETRVIAGDRLGALRLYDQWRARLSDELGATPSTPLDRMAQRLRRGGWDHPTVVVPAAPVEGWQQRPFVGRSAEFARCYEVWEQVRDGTPSHVLLRGDSGIGKTTLVERLATSVALEGAAVARVKCYELERELPFGVIGSMVTQLLDLPGANATAPEQLAELARLVPKVRQRFPSLPDPVPSMGESARLLFTEAAMALVASVADESPVVVSIDDVHLADETSLAVLHLMLRRIDDLPLMVLMTSSSAVRMETPGARKLVEGAASIALSQLHVGSLPSTDATALLDALLSDAAEIGPTLRRALLAGAQGNPLVLELLLADWRRRGDECLALSLGAMTRSADQPPDATFRRLVDQTLVALDPEARAVAELGAILGNRLNDLSMYTLVDLPAARTMRAMTALAGHRVLRDSGNVLEFANEFIRGQCYVGMAAPLRRMLHGAVADRLLADDRSPEPIPGLEIAWHLVRADRLPEAVPYLLAGGREAIRRMAAHEADLALSTGLPALEGAPRRTAILLLAEAQQELGRWRDSLQLLDLAREPFTEAEESCRSVHQVLARRWLSYLAPEQLADATDELFTVAGREIDIETRVKALAGSVRLLALTRDERRLRRLEALLDLVGALEMDAFQALHLILTRGWMLAHRGNTPAALAAITGGVTLASEASIASSIVARLLVGQGCLYCMVGRYSEALEPLHRAAMIAERLDNPSLRGECASQLALAEGRLGNVSSQIAWAREALKSFSATEWGAWVLGATYELGLGLAAEQRYAEARTAVSRLYDNPKQNVPAWITQASLLCAADVMELSGDSRKAYALAKKATTGNLAKLKAAPYSGQFARWITRLAIRDNRIREARIRLTKTFPRLDELDSKDHAEVLGFMTILDSRLGLKATAARKEVERRLALLPAAVTTMVRRLGNDATSPTETWTFR